jgi:hypothetical protein
MYKRNLEHLVTVAVRYFFNFDFTSFNHIYIVAIVILLSIKMLFSKVAYEFYDGGLTIKDDITNLRNAMLTAKQNWMESEMRETVMHNLAAIKNAVTGKDLRLWKLK